MEMEKNTNEDELFMKDLKVRQNKSHLFCTGQCHSIYADNLQNIFRGNL